MDCNPDIIKDLKAGSFTMVIFGSTGNLSQTKLLPAIFQLYQRGFLNKFTILGIGRRKLTEKKYRANTKQAIKKIVGKDFDAKKWSKFSKHLLYHAGDTKEEFTYNEICKLIDSFYKNNIIFYMAVTPSNVPTIITNLAKKKLCKECKNSKIVIEKPFGKDKKTASQLNKKTLAAFNEEQVYRIDHYLGKETVQNIMFFRWSNGIFESLWNRNYIDNIQITVAEKLGIENRGPFYEEAGVIRDIVQNHILQLMTLIAMESPTTMTANFIRDEKVKILHAIRKMKKDDVKTSIVLGQYKSYRKEPKVSQHSITPTYFAGTFYIDNWRWANVPFYIRTGKNLKEKITEIIITFKQPPIQMLGKECGSLEPNRLVINIQPSESISLLFNVKRPGTKNIPQLTEMLFNYDRVFNTKTPMAYERLLLDCIKGDQTLFARQDEIEAMWEVVDPIIKTVEKNKKIDIYPDGSWGPKQANRLIAKDKKKWELY